MREPHSAVPVAAAVTRPLRAAVLRPGRPPADSVYPGDEDPDALHLAVFVDGATVAVGAVVPQDPPADDEFAPPPTPPPPPAGVRPAGKAWRIRGMAVDPGWRNRGLGRMVLDGLLAHVAGRDPSGLVWCNARVAAISLYRRAGFTGDGIVVDLPDIGPHERLYLQIGEERTG